MILMDDDDRYKKSIGADQAFYNCIKMPRSDSLIITI